MNYVVKFLNSLWFQFGAFTLVYCVIDTFSLIDISVAEYSLFVFMALFMNMCKTLSIMSEHVCSFCIYFVVLSETLKQAIVDAANEKK